MEQRIFMAFKIGIKRTTPKRSTKHNKYLKNKNVVIIDIERPKIDCLSLVMCPLLAQLKTRFFSIFFAASVYSKQGKP
jgi:hypothetical protein